MVRGGVVCDYAGDVVPGGSEIVQFIAIIGMGISAVVLLILADRTVSAVLPHSGIRGKIPLAGLSVNAIVDGVWSR